LDRKGRKMFCPKCGYEYRTGFTKCSDCGSDLVDEAPPPRAEEKPCPPPVALYSPSDELELSVIRGLLDAELVQYFVLNDYFGSMRVGPQIDLVNKKIIMVSLEDHDLAKAIISDYLERKAKTDEIEEGYTLSQKLRMVIEALLFTWFIPGRKRQKRDE
jgi:hypothetical protein